MTIKEMFEPLDENEKSESIIKEMFGEIDSMTKEMFDCNVNTLETIRGARLKGKEVLEKVDTFKSHASRGFGIKRRIEETKESIKYGLKRAMHL
jgi:hypothetical protein